MLCGPAVREVPSLAYCCSKQGALLAAWEAKMLVYRMSEGRRAHIILPDERRFEIVIQPKLYAKELLDIVASNVNLREKDYFGLSFIDESGHYQWLQLDRRVLEHEFTKKTGPIELHFAIRFFIEKAAYLQDAVTVELFFQNAVRAIYNGELDCDVDTVFQLAAWVLQALYGDYMDPVTSQERLKKVAVIPGRVLKQHSTIYCEENIIAIYRELQGYRHGQAVLGYMSLVETIPSYGVHYYEVKDKNGATWWLGLSFKGIAIYERTNHVLPVKVFSWKHLENLYFRDRKFSIEVHDPKRVMHARSNCNLYDDAVLQSGDQYDDLTNAIGDLSTQVSVSRRTYGPGNVTVHTWFASTPQLTKCIWSMAVSQHQFYLDRKQSRSQLQHSRSLTDVAVLLNQHHQPPPPSSRHHHPPSTDPSIPSSSSSLASSSPRGSHDIKQQQHPVTSNSGGDYNQLLAQRRDSTVKAEDLEQSRMAKRELHAALKARKEALEATLKKKMEELKVACTAEAQVTGVTPPEMPAGSSESNADANKPLRLGPPTAEERLAQLEMECELQRNVVKAALKLSADPAAPPNVAKQRKLFHKKVASKLREMEMRLENTKRALTKAYQSRSHISLDELSDDSQKRVGSDYEQHTSSPVPYHEYTGSLPHLAKSGQQQVDGSVPAQQRQTTSASRPTTPGLLATTNAPVILRPKSPAVGNSRGYITNSSAAVTDKQLAAGYVPSSVYTAHSGHRERAQQQQTSQGGIAYAQPVPNGSKTSLKSNGGIVALDSGMYRASYVDGSGQLQHDGDFASKTGSLGARQHRAVHQQQHYQTQQVIVNDRHYGSLERSPDGRQSGLETTAGFSPGLAVELSPSKYGSTRDSHSAAANDYQHAHYHHHMHMQQQHVHHYHQYQGGYVQPVVINGHDGKSSAYGQPPPAAVQGQSAYAVDSRLLRQNSQQHPKHHHQVEPSMKKSMDDLRMGNATSQYQQQARQQGGSHVPLPSNAHHLVNNYASETSKPFEMSDVYQYNEQRRRQNPPPAVPVRTTQSLSQASQQQQFTVLPSASQHGHHWGQGNDPNKMAQINRQAANMPMTGRIPTSYSTHDNMAAANGVVVMTDVAKSLRQVTEKSSQHATQDNNTVVTSSSSRTSKSAPQTPQMIHRMV